MVVGAPGGAAVVGGPPTGTAGTPPVDLAVVAVVALGEVFGAVVALVLVVVLVGRGAVVVVVARGSNGVVVPVVWAAAGVTPAAMPTAAASNEKATGTSRRGNGTCTINLEGFDKARPEPSALGLDRRLPERYGEWLRQLLQMWSPHSVLSEPDQRPARASSPSSTGRVQGRQPMDG